MKFTDWIKKEDMKQVFKSEPTQEDLFRIVAGQFTPKEQIIVNKQKQELAKFGVVFTPFKFYGG